MNRVVMGVIVSGLMVLPMAGQGRRPVTTVSPLFLISHFDGNLDSGGTCDESGSCVAYKILQKVTLQAGMTVTRIQYRADGVITPPSNPGLPCPGTVEVVLSDGTSAAVLELPSGLQGGTTVVKDFDSQTLEVYFPAGATVEMWFQHTFTSGDIGCAYGQGNAVAQYSVP